MKLKSKAVKQATHFLLIGLILFEVAIVLIYLGSILLTGKAYHLFDMDGKMTIPSYLQALQLFLIGTISLLLFLFKQEKLERPSRPLMLAIAGLAFYGGLDEIFKLHLGFKNLVPIVGTPYWIAIYCFLLVMLPVLFFPDFKALWYLYRKQTLIGILGVVIFVMGGFGAEIFKSIFFQPLLNLFFPNRMIVAMVAEKFRVAFEEGFELLGETIVLYAILLFIVKRLEKPSIER